MNKVKIIFDEMEWENPTIGAFEKQYTQHNQLIRLIRFESDFLAEEWCTKGHSGYVLGGEMQIKFENEIVSFKKGDGFHILSGEDQKHKVLIEKDSWVELVVFELSPETIT